jgi:hypothetical protein
MRQDEFERNKARFGDNITTWPAPYRQEALDMLAKRSRESGGVDDLDRLIFEAALMDPDELTLSRKVLDRINQKKPLGGFSLLEGFLLRPAGMAACVLAILIAASAGGYQLAQSQNGSGDSALLALATGVPVADSDLSGIAGDPATKEDSL